MKSADVKLGVVYAYQRHAYGSPDPVVVIDKAMWRAGRYGSTSKKADRSYRTRPAIDSGVGMLGLARTARYTEDGSSQGVMPVTEFRATARRVTPDITDGQRTVELDGAASQGVAFQPIDPRFIVGEYDEVVAARAERERLGREHRAAREAADAVRLERARERVEALRALHLPGTLRDPDLSSDGYRLSWEQIDDLLARIDVGPGGGEHVRGEVTTGAT